LIDEPNTFETIELSDQSVTEILRESALKDFAQKLFDHQTWDSRLKTIRQEIRAFEKDYDKTEDNMKALQSVDQIIGEVLKQLD
jgi:26S proteasome regulatory subunit T4